MSKFRLVEHTADTGVVAWGETLPEAFASAAYGMFSIITDLDRILEKESHAVALEENSLEELLFGWLNRLIYLFDVYGLLLKRFDMREFDGQGRLRADCYGEVYDPERHEISIGVKSATYYMLEVDRDKNRVQVIFDI